MAKKSSAKKRVAAKSKQPRTKSSSRKKKATRRKKICSNCGSENANNASSCSDCGRTRFEPNWVVAKRPINRQFSVQVTTSNPSFGKSTKRITLSKWWPGGRATLHIPNPTQWNRIAEIIDSDLASVIGWNKSRELIARLKEHQKDDRKHKKDLKAAVTSNPTLLKDVVAAIDAKKLAESDFESLMDTFAEISDAYSTANAGFRSAFLAVVKKLPAQKQRALEDLDLLLQGWSLNVVTNVAQQVQSRLQTIELFEKQVNDPRTFEIAGDNSIHRILERAMWLIDERYWIMHSNRTLLASIGEEMSKRDKKRYGKKRPDFVCGTVGDKLILLELKRPAHSLKVEDLNQLETYVTVAESYFKFSSYEAYLVGKKIDDELKRTIKHRARSFKLLLYANIMDDTKKRYHKFLKSIQDDS